MPCCEGAERAAVPDEAAVADVAGRDAGARTRRTGLDGGPAMDAAAVAVLVARRFHV
jgi:hypothetical protein